MKAHEPRREPGGEVAGELRRRAVVGRDDDRRPPLAVREDRGDQKRPQRRGAERVRGLAAARARASEREPLLALGEMVEQRRKHQLTWSTIAGALPALAHQRHRRLSGALDERADLGGILAETLEHVGGDDLRIARRGAPDADAHAREARSAELAAQRLQPVVPGEAAADARSHVAEREVDLVMYDEHPVELEPVRAARGSDGAAGVVHERERFEQRDALPEIIDSPLPQAPTEALLRRLLEPPVARERLDDQEADVVARPLVLAPRVTEADEQPVDGAAAREPQDRLLGLAGAVRLGGGGLPRAAVRANEPRLLLDLIVGLEPQARR